MDPPLSQQQQQHYIDDQYPQYAVAASYLPEGTNRKFSDYPQDTDPQIYEQQQQQQQQQYPPNGVQPNNHYYDPQYDMQLQMDVQMHQQQQQQQQHFLPQQNYPQDWEQQQYAEYNDPMYQQQMMMQQQPFPPTERSGSMSSLQSGAYGQNPNQEQTASPASVTPEALEIYREEAKRSNDPQIQLEFAKFLVDAAAMAPDSVPGDAKASKKYREGLMAEGIKSIKRLASQGIGLSRPAYPEAQFFLANCYGTGALGLPIDHDKAFSLYVQASKQSHPAATYRTSVCYEVGAGTKRDHARATQFYRKAAALGDTAAMYKLGMILLNGLLGQQKNPREAITWLKRASAVADEENPHALHELGLCYETAGIPNLIPDEAYSRELFTQAAQLGYAPSQFKMGCCYEYGTLTCPVDPRRSIAWYTRAAEQGDPESELALSGWYLTGSEGVLRQSDTEAYLWARKAADKGLAKAEYAVGYYSEVGIGVKMDLDEARRWYMRAAAQGNKRAMQRLTDLKRLGSASRKAKPEKHTRGKDGDCTIC